MRLKKPEMAVLLLVLLAFAVMGGFFLGRNTVSGPVRIVTRSTARAVPENGTRAAPSPQDQLGAFPVNINTATAAELQTLPGIGEARAEAIVAYREEHGPFAYVEDLRGVSGIGEGILADIMDYITVGRKQWRRS